VNDLDAAHSDASLWNERVAANVLQIRERIGAAAARGVFSGARDPGDVTLIAVSKTVPAEAIRAAYAADIRHFGENRVQEWESKRPALEDLSGALCHLIGGLQSNKVRRAVKLFQFVDSVDSVDLARRVSQACVEDRGGATAQIATWRLPILLEVLLAPEELKGGVCESELPALAEAVLALPLLELRGLMCIPPYCENPEDARPYFRKLAQLRQALALRLDTVLPALSMGMSHDFEIAIEEGATEIRIGTGIFGARAKT
jgi:hypothetical protein